MSCAVLTDAAQIAFSVGSLDANDPPAARPDCANTTDAAHTAPSTSTCRRGTMASLRRSGNERMRQMSGLGRARQRDHRHRDGAALRGTIAARTCDCLAQVAPVCRRQDATSAAISCGESCVSARRRGARSTTVAAADTRDALSGRTSRDRPGWRLPCRRAAGREHRRQLPTQAPGKPPALDRRALPAWSARWTRARRSRRPAPLPPTPRAQLEARSPRSAYGLVVGFVRGPRSTVPTPDARPDQKRRQQHEAGDDRRAEQERVGSDVRRRVAGSAR